METEEAPDDEGEGVGDGHFGWWRISRRGDASIDKTRGLEKDGIDVRGHFDKRRRLYMLKVVLDEASLLTAKCLDAS